MERNLGSTDRIVRGLLGVALVGTGLSVGRRSWWGVALGAVGSVLVFSACKGFCHVYKVLGVCSSEESPCAYRRGGKGTSTDVRSL